MKLPLSTGNLQKDVAAVHRLLHEHFSYALKNTLDGASQDFVGLAEEFYANIPADDYLYALAARQLFKRMDYPARYRIYSQNEMQLLCVECFGLHLSRTLPEPRTSRQLQATGYALEHVSGANPQEAWRDMREIQ